MKVFISGGMTGLPDLNRPAFMEAEERLRAQGHLVWNPAMHPCGFEHEEYLAACLPAVEFCDAIYQLRGWEKSKGARMEFERAVKCGKVIIQEAPHD